MQKKWTSLAKGYSYLEGMKTPDLSNYSLFINDINIHHISFFPSYHLFIVPFVSLSYLLTCILYVFPFSSRFPSPLVYLFIDVWNERGIDWPSSAHSTAVTGLSLPLFLQLTACWHTSFVLIRKSRSAVDVLLKSRFQHKSLSSKKAKDRYAGSGQRYKLREEKRRRTRWAADESTAVLRSRCFTPVSSYIHLPPWPPSKAPRETWNIFSVRLIISRWRFENTSLLALGRFR